VSSLRVRFAQGIALEAVGRWADALDRFMVVRDARPTAEVAFHIGLCLDRLGRLRQAERAYLESRQLGKASSPIVVGEATERLRDLDARMPRVTVSVAGAGSGVTVAIDGEPIAPGATARLDPGPHVATAARGGVSLAAVAFSAQERRARAITLMVLIGPEGAPRQRVPAGGESPIARATPSR
jgi:tetratricopeptide (TPR) repeat protein